MTTQKQSDGPSHDAKRQRNRSIALGKTNLLLALLGLLVLAGAYWVGLLPAFLPESLSLLVLTFFGLWAFAVAFVGAALTVGNAWAEVFVWPTLAQAAPNMMSVSVTDMSLYLVAGLNVSFPLFALGLILFGVATVRAGVYPIWVTLLLVVSIPLTMFLDPTPGSFQESIGQILLGIAVASLGWHAARSPSSITS